MAGSAAAAVRLLEQRLERVEPAGTSITVAPMADSVEAALLPVRIAAALLASLGAIGIGLAMTGLFAVISQSVTRRTFEFGVRMALGASRTAIVAMILRDGVSIVGAGCAIGAVVAFAIARVLQSAVTSQSLVDPVAFAVALLLLLATGLVSSMRPARRAAAAEPIVALRSE